MFAAGFGLNFYGYFVFAALWVSGYFVWASRVNARERRREAAVKSGEPGARSSGSSH
jgi:hypothetical protein